jgi:hypothetical protein
MQRVMFVTGERPAVFWGYDLAGDNARFLKTLDAEYFGFVARECAARLKDETTLERADRLRVATTLRIAYGQAAETLMALLAATAQIPTFPMGWMLRYQNQDLREVVTAIESERPFHSLLVERPVTWRTISALVHSYIPGPAERLGLIDRAATFWSRMAQQFLSDHHQNEYNALKHGLRVMPGGFSIAFGVEKTPGQPAAPEDMTSLGGSQFGATYVVPVRIDGAAKHHFRISRESRNWSYEALAIDLQLMAQSMANVVGSLRVVGGDDASRVRFSWPNGTDDDAFTRYRDFLPSLERLSRPDNVLAEDIAPVTAAEIIAAYEHAQDRPASEPPETTDTAGS